MASVHITDDELTISLSRGEKLLGLLGDLTVPRDAITSVDLVTDGARAVRGLRAPGLGLPGRKIGTWRGRGGERRYVSVRRGRPALRLRLSGQRYTAALVEVADPEAALAALVAEPAR